MKRVFVYPWKMASTSARDLAKAIGVKRVFPDGKYKPRKGDILINWGMTQIPNWWDAFQEASGTIINAPAHIAGATNKKVAFEQMKGKVNIPDFTSKKSDVLSWIQGGDIAVARKILSGHSAAGIRLLGGEENYANVDDIPLAPLYTKYRKKKEEYRVHILNGVVIDVSQKKLKNGLDKNTVNYKVRNHAAGWVFARSGIAPPKGVLEEAKKAMKALDLDMGAVDIGWNKKHQEATVYEVNTAPGLVGTTLYLYASALAAMTGRPLLIQKPPTLDDDVADFDTNEFADS